KLVALDRAALALAVEWIELDERGIHLRLALRPGDDAAERRRVALFADRHDHALAARGLRRDLVAAVRVGGHGDALVVRNPAVAVDVHRDRHGCAGERRAAAAVAGGGHESAHREVGALHRAAI